MSILTWSSKLFSLTPRIRAHGDTLYARTNLLAQFLSLFSYSKSLWVDKNRERVTVHKRFLWFFGRPKQIPFQRLYYIDTDFSSIGTSWGSILTGFERTDQLESFTVNLVLQDPEETVPLFKFVGEGSVNTGWTGVLLGGDDIVDMSGDQQESRCRFTDLLTEYTGIKVGKPVPHLADEEGNKYVCASCGHAAPPNNSNCLYCGGEITEQM